MGHYLSLGHPFDGDCDGDNDLVADTPKMKSPDPRIAISCDGDIPSTCGSLDMTMNLMAYGPDKCLTMFTKGQVARMRATVSPGGPRVGVVQ